LTSGKAEPVILETGRVADNNSLRLSFVATDIRFAHWRGAGGWAAEHGGHL